MLFGTDKADRALTVVDWQTVSWGPALTDLAYFLGGALRTEDRPAQYDALLRAYHERWGLMRRSPSAMSGKAYAGRAFSVS